jgi:RNA polymerase sigma-70 factor (ECF subfamily)
MGAQQALDGSRLQDAEGSLAESRDVDPRLEALRAGDPETTCEVLRELLPCVRRWLYRLLGPGGELDDATQESLTELARALPRFEGRSTLATLAHRITVRVAYRFFGRARRARETSLELVLPPPDQVDPLTRIMGREALRRLHRCLDRLPQRRRVAFVLCAVEGLTPSEAADVAGVSATAMRSRLMHARSEVARMLGADPSLAALLKGEVR